MWRLVHFKHIAKIRQIYIEAIRHVSSNISKAMLMHSKNRTLLFDFKYILIEHFKLGVLPLYLSPSLRVSKY